MLLGNGLLPHFGIAGGGGLVGSTWARDGSGRAYNTPTLGSDLVTNGGFSADTNWTKAANWTIAAGVAAGDGSNGYIDQTTLTMTVGQWMQAEVDIVTRVGGTLLLQIGATVLEAVSSVAVGNIRTGRATAGFLRLYGTSFSGTIDNVSLKAISAPTLHAATLGTANNLAAIARINALTSGTQAGCFALVDNPANPANGIYAYHDGVGVTLDKLVAGTWSNVNARVTAAFSADADLEIRPLGSNQFDVYYGGTKRGATATIADAEITSNLYYGLFSTYSGNTFTRFTLGGNVVPFGF